MRRSLHAAAVFCNWVLCHLTSVIPEHMTSLDLEQYRDLVKTFESEGMPLLEAMSTARKLHPHRLNEPQTGGIIEIRNELINTYGAADVFREAYRQLRAELQSGGVKEILMMVGAPGAGKSHYSLSSVCRGQIIFDSAGATPRARKAVVNMAKEHGARVSAMIVNTPLRVCLQRQSSRGPDKAVPADVVTAAWNSVQAFPPTMAEGFDAVYTEQGSSQDVR